MNMRTLKLGLPILIFALLLASPAVGVAQEEPAKYNFASAEGNTSLQIIPGEQAQGHIYFYNIDGNRITHITLEVAPDPAVPAGWEVEIDPPKHEIQVSFGGDAITITENLHAEPTQLHSEEIKDVPEGMVSLALPNRGATPDEPGYALAKVVTITITVPESEEVGVQADIRIHGVAEWLGQTGAAAIGQTRDFDFTVRTVYEVTGEEIIGGGGFHFDVGRWLPIILAVAIVALAAVMLPRYMRRKRTEG